MNRVVTTRLATLHFAPTPLAAGRVAAEGVAAERIFVTGNSGIDAVLYVRDALAGGSMAAAPWPQLDATRKLIVVTAHRQCEPPRRWRRTRVGRRPRPAGTSSPIGESPGWKHRSE